MESPAFFNPWSDIERCKNRLPHWQQVGGGTYFLTWRLADSIPQAVLESFFVERSCWMQQHPEPWEPEEEMEYHLRFSNQLDRFMDQNWGSCVLRHPGVAKEVQSCLLRWHDDRLFVHCSIVMPNHVHALASLRASETLSKVIKAWKGNSAYRINRHLGSSGSLWQKDYFDRLIRDGTHFSNCVRYIRNNPAKAKLRDGFLLFESDTAKIVE